jgi:hypothetical protein
MSMFGEQIWLLSGFSQTARSVFPELRSLEAWIGDFSTIERQTVSAQTGGPCIHRQIM